MVSFQLVKRLWNDDCGGIISSEYLLVASILGLGTVSGLAALRDAQVEEMREMGNSMRAVREHFAPHELQKQQMPTAPPAGQNVGRGGAVMPTP
jgi:hypothetical protein